MRSGPPRYSFHSREPYDFLFSDLHATNPARASTGTATNKFFISKFVNWLGDQLLNAGKGKCKQDVVIKKFGEQNRHTLKSLSCLAWLANEIDKQMSEIFLARE